MKGAPESQLTGRTLCTTLIKYHVLVLQKQVPVLHTRVINNYSIHVGYMKDNVGITHRVKHGACHLST